MYMIYQLNANITMQISRVCLNFDWSTLKSSGEEIMQGPNFSKQQKSFCISETLEKFILNERKYILTKVFWQLSINNGNIKQQPYKEID